MHGRIARHPNSAQQRNRGGRGDSRGGGRNRHGAARGGSPRVTSASGGLVHRPSAVRVPLDEVGPKHGQAGRHRLVRLRAGDGKPQGGKTRDCAESSEQRRAECVSSRCTRVLSVDNKSPCSAPRLALPRRQSSPRPYLGHISATSRPYLGYISAISRPNAHHHRERAVLERHVRLGAGRQCGGDEAVQLVVGGAGMVSSLHQPRVNLLVRLDDRAALEVGGRPRALLPSASLGRTSGRALARLSASSRRDLAPRTLR